MLIIWIKFFACALLILYAGSRLTRYADIIAEKTGLGRAWIGLVLLASITSLPELSNNIAAVAFVGAPDLAFGDLFGSCLFNILIIAMLDLFHGPGPILSKADIGNILTAALGILLLGTAASGIILSHAGLEISVLTISIFTLTIAAVYLLSERMIFLHEKRKQQEYLKDKNLLYKERSLSRAVAGFFFSAVIVVAAGSYLPYVGQEIAAATGIGTTFIGTLLLAAATSMPEIVVSATALRLGSVDMAVGNVFGSNIFNMFILFLDDIFYTGGPILAAVSQTHVFTAMAAIIMTAIAVSGLIYRLDRKAFGKISWDAIAIIAVYLFTIYVLFRMGLSGLH